MYQSAIRALLTLEVPDGETNKGTGGGRGAWMQVAGGRAREALGRQRLAAGSAGTQAEEAGERRMLVAEPRLRCGQRGSRRLAREQQLMQSDHQTLGRSVRYRRDAGDHRT